MNVLSPAVAVSIFVGGTLGSDGVVTGGILVHAIILAVGVYDFCRGVDWAMARKRVTGM